MMENDNIESKALFQIELPESISLINLDSCSNKVQSDA